MNHIRTIIVAFLSKQLGINSTGDDHEIFLNNIHNNLDIKNLNQIRIDCFRHMNSFDWFRPSIFSIAKEKV